MNFLHTIIEFEGPIVDVQPRYWAAHREAIEALGFDGPVQKEWWRLLRTGATEGQIIRFGKQRHVEEYQRIRDERCDADDLMQADEIQPGAKECLPILKRLGTSSLVTLCRNRDAVNKALDRFDIWMNFENKQVLPENRDRRIDAIRQLTGSSRALAIVGSVSMAYAANEAGCLVVGMKSGTAVPNRLRQVGAGAIYASLDEFTDAITSRDPELQKMGLF